MYDLESNGKKKKKIESNERSCHFPLWILEFEGVLSAYK